MKKRLRLLIALLTLPLLSLYCSGESHSDKSESGHHAHTANNSGMHTETYDLENMRVVLDVMTIEQHKEMMKMMGHNDMDHNPAASHFISITLLSAEKQMLGDAKVEITIYTEDGQTIEQNAGIMSDAGMVHYGADFTLNSGEHAISVKIDRDGEINMIKGELAI